jgi:hypothetical protein
MHVGDVERGKLYFGFVTMPCHCASNILIAVHVALDCDHSIDGLVSLVFVQVTSVSTCF